MKNVEAWQNKTYLIMGLGKSGWGMMSFLQKIGTRIFLYDDRKKLTEEERARLDKYEVPAPFKSPAEVPYETLDFLVKSPGIPYQHPLIQEAQDRSIPVITDIEIISQVTEADLIAVTGSNGKSTTSQLIGDLLNLDRKTGQAIVAGNIGVSVAEALPGADPKDDAVVELSSFQLMGTKNFHPQISVLTNIYPSHLDWHVDYEEYVEAKAQIIANQTEQDYFIYNGDQEEVVALAEKAKAQTLAFSLTGKNQEAFYTKDQWIYFRGEALISFEDIRLPGLHNIENIMAALAVAYLKGVDKDKALEYLKVFPGIPHRLEYLGEQAGRLFYNDSKATNLKATQKALSAFQKPVILLAGGLDRGENFSALVPLLKDRVKALVSMGENRDKLLQAGQEAGLQALEPAFSMEEAVNKALAFSEVGDIILLSPASASWDEYKSFEERGLAFKEAVQHYDFEEEEP